MPLISIITVCYNSARTIEETIRSVIAQQYSQREYVIIDGASQDETVAIAQRYQAHITHLVSEKDAGIYDAMNKGIRLAQGEIIGLLNADDIYPDSQVLTQVAQVFSDANVQACYGDLIYFSDKAPEKIVRYWQGRAFKPGAFAKGWAPAHPTFFVRKSVYEQYGLFDTSYSMGNDVELMMRFLEKHRINSVYLPKILVKMRLGGVSNQGISNIIEQNLNILRAAKKLQIPMTPLKFVLHKLADRLAQFISRRKFSYDKL